MSYKIPIQVSEIELVYKSKVRAEERPQITCSRDAYWILESNWSPQISIQEEFNILYLDRMNRAMALSTMFRGGVAGTVVDLKLVYAAALKCRASSILISHNHPSGNLRPSQADIDLTQKFKKAGELLELPLLDHLILSPEGGYYSFMDENQI